MSPWKYHRDVMLCITQWLQSITQMWFGPNCVHPGMTIKQQQQKEKEFDTNWISRPLKSMVTIPDKEKQKSNQTKTKPFQSWTKACQSSTQACCHV